MARGSALSTAARELLLREFDQAWMHYRQVETRGAQGLGLVFALAIGSSATIVSIGATSQPLALRLLASSGVLLLFESISVVSLVVLRKLQAVGNHYAAVFRRIRAEIYGDDVTAWPVPLADLDVWIAHGHERIFRSRMCSVAWISDALLLGAAGIAATTIAVLSVRLFLLSAPGWEKAVLVVVAFVAMVLPIAARFALGPLDRVPQG